MWLTALIEQTINFAFRRCLHYYWSLVGWGFVVTVNSNKPAHRDYVVVHRRSTAVVTNLSDLSFDITRSNMPYEGQYFLRETKFRVLWPNFLTLSRTIGD